MITFKRLGPIVETVIRDLKQIASDMSSYKKIKTDLRAVSLINEVNAKIREIKIAYDTFVRDGLSNLYANYDFTDWVKKIQGYVDEYRSTHERIMKFEDIVEYY